jgi:hypothetical protein
MDHRRGGDATTANRRTGVENFGSNYGSVKLQRVIVDFHDASNLGAF